MTVSKVCTLSDTMAKVFTRSTLLGSIAMYGCERWDPRGKDGKAFPIIKFAMPNDDSRDYVKREWENPRSLEATGLALKVYPEPLVDDDGVFGYRLEDHRRVHGQTSERRAPEVRALIAKLHQAGWCYGHLNANSSTSPQRHQDRGDTPSSNRPFKFSCD